MSPLVALALLWGLALLIMGVVFAAGGLVQRRLRAAAPWPGPWPRVSVIVPAKGASASFADEIGSILDQDYPDFEVILAVQDANDPAYGAARDLARRRGGPKVVLAGQSQTCGQKNYNLLAGLAAADPAGRVLVFSDSGHQAPPDWLRRLVEPVAAGRGEVASGFHQAVAEAGGLWAQAWLVCLQLMFWSRHVGFMRQPWGGATAITRSLLDHLDLAGMWSQTVVDDVTLGRRLRQADRVMQPVPDPPLLTRLQAVSWRQWFDWLNRQLIYIKFIDPASWLLLGLVSWGLLALVLAALAAVVALAAGAAPPWFGLSAAAFLVGLVLLVHLPRTNHPQPGPLAAWTPAGVALLFTAALGFIRNAFCRHIDWGGIRYRVGLGGRVRSITRPGLGQHDTTPPRGSRT